MNFLTSLQIFLSAGSEWEEKSIKIEEVVFQKKKNTSYKQRNWCTSHNDAFSQASLISSWCSASFVPDGSPTQALEMKAALQSWTSDDWHFTCVFCQIFMLPRGPPLQRNWLLATLLVLSVTSSLMTYVNSFCVTKRGMKRETIAVFRRLKNNWRDTYSCFWWCFQVHVLLRRNGKVSRFPQIILEIIQTCFCDRLRIK